MRKLHIMGLALTIISLLVLVACIPLPFRGPDQQPYLGFGMMGRGGPGMMGRNWGNNNPNPNAKPLTIDQAADAVRFYLNAYTGKLVLTEVMNFAWNYYAEVEETNTGIHAMELLIDKYNGRVSPEMGPNLTWNTKYSAMGGMMGKYVRGTPTANMPVNAEQAKTLAQQYLDIQVPGLTVAEADTFYGYYTLHTLKKDQLEGMLSVNGYTGAVWYHSWHGPFIDMKEVN